MTNRSCKSALFTLREDGATELISVCLRLKYDPLSDRRNFWHGRMIRGCRGRSLEVTPVESRLSLSVVDSVWLVEQRAVAVTKPGAQRLCLAEKVRSWGRQIGWRIRKIPSIDLVVWTGQVESAI